MEASILERHIKKTTIISNIVGVLVALGATLSVGYAFFYQTRFTQNEHSASIREIKNDVSAIKQELNSSNLTGNVSVVEINNLKKDVNRIEANQNRIEEKIDKMLIITRSIQTNQ